MICKGNQSVWATNSINFMPGIHMQCLISCPKFHSYFCELHSVPREATVEALTAQNHMDCVLRVFHSITLHGLIWALKILITSTLATLFDFRDLGCKFTLRRQRNLLQDKKNTYSQYTVQKCNKIIVNPKSKEEIKIDCPLYSLFLECLYLEFKNILV